MKNKIINIIKKTLFYVGILFVSIIILALIFGPETNKKDLNDKVIVNQVERLKTVKNKPDTGKLEDKKEVKKTEQDLFKEKYINKTFTIDHKKTFDIDGYKGSVNLWLSVNNRTLTGKTSRYDKVILLDHDKNNFYCKVKKNDNNIGWTLCDWLSELPKEYKSMQ